MDEFDKVSARDGAFWTDAMRCRAHLAMYRDALSETLRFASLVHQEWQAIAVDADENGVFSIAIPHPGKYVIVANGHAGFNEAFWEIGVPDRVVVKAELNTVVKVPSPAESCVME